MHFLVLFSALRPFKHPGSWDEVPGLEPWIESLEAVQEAVERAVEKCAGALRPVLREKLDYLNVFLEAFALSYACRKCAPRYRL